jgi:hypothetical protein
MGTGQYDEKKHKRDKYGHWSSVEQRHGKGLNVKDDKKGGFKPKRPEVKLDKGPEQPDENTVRPPSKEPTMGVVGKDKGSSPTTRDTAELEMAAAEREWKQETPRSQFTSDLEFYNKLVKDAETEYEAARSNTVKMAEHLDREGQDELIRQQQVARVKRDEALMGRRGHIQKQLVKAGFHGSSVVNDYVAEIDPDKLSKFPQGTRYAHAGVTMSGTIITERGGYSREHKTVAEAVEYLSSTSSSLAPKGKQTTLRVTNVVTQASQDLINGKMRGYLQDETNAAAAHKPLVPKGLPTAAQVKDNIIGVDELSRSGDVYTARRGFFYRHGNNEDSVVASIRKAYPGMIVVSKGEVDKPFRGGAPIRAQSHWWVKFKLK